MAQKLTIKRRQEILKAHYDKCLQDDCPVCYKFLQATIQLKASENEELAYELHKATATATN